MSQIFDIDELSLYLKIPKQTLYKIARERKIPGQKVGRHWRFSKSAIDKWLESKNSNLKENQVVV